MTCEELITAYLVTLREGFHCKVASNGRLSVLTPYLYPDHDNIEVFVRPKGDEIAVSDLGETLRILDTVGLDICGIPDSLFAAERIAEGFGVKIDRGILVKQGSVAKAGSLIFDVILACQSVGSLVYGSRAYEPAIFEDEVKDYLEENDIAVDRNVKEQGASGTKYIVSLRAQVAGRTALISAISPKINAGVRGKVNYNFRMWSDLNGSLTKDKKINLLNDDMLAFKQEDTNILERVSTVFRWTNRQKLISALQGNSPLSPQSVG